MKKNVTVKDLVAAAQKLEKVYRALSGQQDAFRQSAVLNEILFRAFLGFCPKAKRSSNRMGADATCGKRQYEMKTVNARTCKGALKGNLFVTSERTLTLENLSRLSNSVWVVGVFDGLTLVEAWAVNPGALKPYFSQWSARLMAEGRPLNNPKIPMEVIRSLGIQFLP